MKFLIVNDDGFEGKGIHLLVDALSKYGICFVVTPNRERSCSSQAITLFNAIKIEPFKIKNAEKAYKIDGLPGDCTRVGLHLFKDIDIVFSGVNHGSNLGTDIIYSGTVGAATEGIILNKKAVAISTDHTHFGIVERELDAVLKYLLVDHFELISDQYVLNINFPHRTFEKSKGIKYTFMGKRFFDCYFENLEEHLLIPKGDLLSRVESEGSDCDYFERGYITITPVGLNRTRYADLEKLKAYEIEGFNE